MEYVWELKESVVPLLWFGWGEVVVNASRQFSADIIDVWLVLEDDRAIH